MKKTPHLCAVLICFIETLFSLPQDPSIAEGSVQIHHKNKKTMVVKTSEKAIINYKDFNIDLDEKVQFIQPNAKSCVLNRISGGDGSKILGQIESNGAVFLVNPNGIYFGKKAKVNVGSLIASTLDISDENFLQDRFSFSLQDKNRLTEIYNEGFLSASNEGAIVLMAPIIKNTGVIQAHVGHVVLASAEHVTLRFHEDKLLSFSVEGEIKEALLEHLGTIQAKEVTLRLPTAKRAIKEVVNRDGIEPGVAFINDNGKILLAAKSSIQTENLSLEAPNVKLEGKIDASNTSSNGGSIHITGGDIFLKGAILDVSGKTGGGTLLIGGDFRGEGPLPYASTVSVDPTSTLFANATEVGNGGLIVLFSDQSTSFEGTCYAKGGLSGGHGGIVETSSLGEIFISKAYVDTLAPLGNIGSWLLDPAMIRITAIGGGIPSGCSTSGDIAVATLEAQASTVTLCADIIMQEVPISMSVPGAGLIFQSSTGSTGTLVLQNDITTIGGPIEVQNLNTLVLGSLTLDTTGSGSSGANITLGRMNTDNNLEALTLKAGIGNVTLKALGDLDPFGAIQITANQITLNKIFTSSSPITLSGAILIQGDSVISTTASGSGATITLDTVNGSSLDRDSLTLDAGSLGSLSLGNVGSSTPLHNFTLINANVASIQDITSHSGSIDLHSPITLTQSLTSFTIVRGNGSSNIRAAAIEGTTAYTESLTFSTGSKDKILLGETGLTTPLNRIILGSNQSLFVENVRAADFRVTSQVGTTTLNADIATTGSEGVSIETGNLILKGKIQTDKLSLIAHGPITAGNSRQDILVRSSGTTLINALNGSLGEQTIPISLRVENLVDPIVIGAKTLASLAGPSYERKLFTFDPNNPPCIFIFNNHTFFDCNRNINITFNQLPRSFFMGGNRFNSQRLGIGTNLLTQFGPYFLSSYFTDSFLQRIEVPSRPQEAKCEGQRVFTEEESSFELNDHL